MPAGLQYKTTFNLASAAGSLKTTVDKMNPARHTSGSSNFYAPVTSQRRKLSAVNITFSGQASQTFTVSVVDQDGTARIINSTALVNATSAYFEPEHDIWISPLEDFQVDVTATGSPAITGTITIFTEEQ